MTLMQEIDETLVFPTVGTIVYLICSAPALLSVLYLLSPLVYLLLSACCLLSSATVFCRLSIDTSKGVRKVSLVTLLARNRTSRLSSAVLYEREGVSVSTLAAISASGYL